MPEIEQSCGAILSIHGVPFSPAHTHSIFLCLRHCLLSFWCYAGQATPKKVGLGGAWFLVLLVALVGPLIIFSSLNPAQTSNAVTSINIQLCACQ